MPECIDPLFYRSRYPGTSVPEARALLLLSFSEHDLPPELVAETQSHLSACSYCNEYLKELEQPFDLKSSRDIRSAVCPSSELIDIYLFDRNELHESQVEKLEQHLHDCDLCRSESEWLRNLESRTPKSGGWHSSRWLQSVVAAAAALFLAVSAFLFWQASENNSRSQQLKNLAVIKEPNQINYVSLVNTSTELPGQTQAVFENAMEKVKQEQYAQAATGFENVLKESPEHAASLFLLGYSYYKMDQPDKAFSLCHRAEQIRPHSYERCMFLVHVALATGNFERARLEITSLYHEAPQIPEVRALYQKITELMPPDRTRL